MKARSSSVFWGIIFLLAGGALLADRMGWVDFSRFSNNVWVYLFAGAGLLFLLGYVVGGLRNWGLLFPALILPAVGLTMWMGDRNLGGAAMGLPILLAVAIPFFVGFALDRKQWGLLIPGYVLVVSALVTLISAAVPGNLIGALFLYAIAVPFLAVFLLNRARWWALIPAWATFVCGTTALLADHVDGNLIGAFFLYAVALPFLVVYLTGRSRRWALIPAAAVAAVGTITLVAGLVGGDWVGALVMLVFAAPFFFLYFRWKENWWALIPAGVFTSIALVVLLGMFVPQNLPVFHGILTGVLLFGLGLTFGGLWLQRSVHPTAWARFPALGLFAAAVLAAVLGDNTNVFWAIVLMAGGIALVAYNFLRKKPGSQA